MSLLFFNLEQRLQLTPVIISQVCVSPDYILVPRAHQDRLVEALKYAYSSFFPKGGLDADSQLSTIINPAHHDRLEKLLRSSGGKIISGGTSQEKRRIDISILRDVALNDSVMEE